MDEKKIALLIQIAQMYYEDGMNQEEISQRLDLSRPYISRLLTEAKNQGFIQFKVIDPLDTESALEKKLRKLTKLDKVIIAPSKNNISRLTNVSKKAVIYLESIVKNGDIISFSWGNTIYSVSTLLEHHHNLTDVIAVQLCGGISNLQHNIYSSEIGKNFSLAWSAKPYVLTCPVLVDDKLVREVFLNDYNVKEVMNYGYQSNIALFTMGAFGLQSALYRAGYMDAKEIYRLTKMGAVGDICTHIVNAQGEICDSALDERTVSVPLDIIKKKKYRIGIAEGQSKVDCICAAIKGNIVNVLITDEETATWIAERFES